MTITLGENIKKMRIAQDITQEQLAEALGVSPQAVSRWENAASYPDIQLLPIIARYFDITVDKLIGADAARKEKKIKNIQEQVQKLRNKGKSYGAVCLLKEKVKEYPNSAVLLYELASALYSFYHQGDAKLDEEKYKEYAEETVEFCKKALKYSEEAHITYGCKQLLVFNYVNLGEYDKAKEIAEELPNIWFSSTMMLPRATKDKKQALELYQSNVLLFLEALLMTLGKIGGSCDYTVEQKLELKLMREKIILAVLGENPGFFNSRLYDLKIKIAWEYVKLDRCDEAIEAIEKALQYAINYEERSNNGKYSVFWLSEVTENAEYTVKHSEKTLYEDIAEHMANICYHDSNYENDERFKSLKDKVQKYLATV